MQKTPAHEISHPTAPLCGTTPSAPRRAPGTLALLWTCLLINGLSAGVVQAAPAHYLVLEADGATVEALFYRQVDLAETPRGGDADKLLAGRVHEAEGRPMLWVELVSDDPVDAGKTLYRDVVALPSELRGEFHADHALEDGGSIERPGIEHHRIEHGPIPFVLRLPVVEGARLRLSGQATAEFDLDALAERAESLPLAQTLASDKVAIDPVATTKDSGSSANRADFLILGDGYTAAQRGKFDADANRLQNQVFSITPYREYRSFAKVSRLFVASAQSGADHPPFQGNCSSSACCSDIDAQGDPRSGTFVDTALDATFCTANIQRLLTVNYAKTLAVASAAPNWDQILVMVNDPVYGGSGGALAVASLHTAAVEVMQHELGHSFTFLADEYETSNPGTTACREAFGSCEANVTDQNQRAQVKWRPWILPSTPVPTPGNLGFSDVVGLFEGARYLSVGQYRPRFDCQMRSLGVPFCEVCAQEYVLRLFQGGFGIPANGIDPIEPGSESPRPGAVTLGSAPLTLSASLLQPSAGPRLTVEWWVDGEIVPGATDPSLVFAPEDAGTYQVELRVDASTPLVHPQMGGTTLGSSRRWTVTTAGLGPSLEAAFEWQGSQAGEAIDFVDGSTGEPDTWLWEFGDGTTSAEQNPTHVFATPGIHPVRLTVGLEDASSTIERNVRVYPTGSGPCTDGTGSLCLGVGDRFEIETLWRDPEAGTGIGRVVPEGSLDSGLFHFFGANNWELLIKVIDGCGFNDRFWLFGAATTTVEYALRVTDTATGSVKEYLNPAGNASPAITDIEAFATCDATVPATSEATTLPSTQAQQPARRLTVEPGTACTEDDLHLCLLDDRFEVTLDWRDHDGNVGSASLTPARSANSGTLWFFNPANWELLIKVIDGCGFNDRFWVFGAASTDVEYTLRVRHVASGEVVEYFNPLARVSPPITDTDALAVCE